MEVAQASDRPYKDLNRQWTFAVQPRGERPNDAAQRHTCFYSIRPRRDS